MIRILLLIGTLVMSALSAKLEDHFKKAVDKSGNHQLRNIDFIYMINLDERPEKYAEMVKLLTPYGIFPYRFSAVNGWELSTEVINDVGVKYEPWMKKNQRGTYYSLEDGQPHHEMVRTVGRTYFFHTLPPGSIGIVLSHLSVLQDAYDSGYETIWVLEDDLEIFKDPRIVPDLIDKLDALVGKDGWDILFTDRDQKGLDGSYHVCQAIGWRPNFSPPDPEKFTKRQDVSPEFRFVGSRYGGYSMIVRRSGMEKILNFFKTHHIYLPYDMDYIFPGNMRMYTVLDDVVSTQPRGLSDNSAPNYRKKA